MLQTGNLSATVVAFSKIVQQQFFGEFGAKLSNYFVSSKTAGGLLGPGGRSESGRERS